MKKYELIAPDATKSSRGQKTETPLMRRLGLMLALVILGLLAQTINIAAQERQASDQRPSKQMTEQQARARTFAILQTEMKKTGRINDGWQEVYKNSKGVIYAHVQNGKVTNLAVGNAKTDSKIAVEALRLHAPKGTGDVRDIGDTVVLQPNNEPTDEQRAKCKKKLGRCVLSTLFSLNAPALLSGSWLAIGGAILEDAEKSESVESCLGSTCRKILGID